MRSITDVLHDVLDNTDVESIVTAAQVEQLHRELCDALLAAGHPVTERSPRWGGEYRLRGVATLHLEGPAAEDGRYGVADLTANVSLWLTPVIREEQQLPDGPLTHYEPDTLGLVHYDVWLEGFTVPRDGGEHLRLTEVQS